MKKCPPGVICIENITLFFVLITLFIVGYIVFSNLKQKEKQKKKHYNNYNYNYGGSLEIVETPNYPYNNLPRPDMDVLLNPYTPPLKDERYINTDLVFTPPRPLRVPINVSTNPGAVDTNYRQVGILTPLKDSNKNKILPLMGRPLFTNRQKWQYYTMSDQNNSVKLPIIIKGRSATNDYGVDEVFNNDKIYVEGYNEAFKVTTYDGDTIKYLPFI